MSDDEKTQLKAEADALGITYSPNIGVDALRKKIEDHKAAAVNPPEELVPVELSPAEQRQHEHKVRCEQQREELKQVRIRLTCMNPSKAELKGEMVTVGNAIIGTVTKFIPFSPDFYVDGYHVPNIIYKELKARKFNHVTTKKNEKGLPEPVQQMVNEFNIELLPMLTEAELAALKTEQAAKAGK